MKYICDIINTYLIISSVTLDTFWPQDQEKKRAEKKGSCRLEGLDLEIDQLGDFVSVIVLIPLPPPLETRIRI